jgi:LDH2 family malate/lactate/ureidoglycolate dehydrogenase
MGSRRREGAFVTEPQRYRAEDLHQFCCAVLEKLNVPSEDARKVGDCLVLADLRGVDSHGVIRLPVYAKRIRKNVVNARAIPRIISSHAAAALMDGDNGLGAVVGSRAMETAINLAATAGIGFVGVRRTNHFGIAAFYVQKALQNGFIGCAASNAPPHMAPFGGRARFLGTNPFSIGIPANQEAPLLFDASTSVVARGKIIVAAQEGKTIPSGWAIDPEGNPTTNAKAALAGSVLPFGGPKGSAVSFIIDVLSGVLTGSAFALHLSTLENLEAEQNLGHIFMAMRTDLFMSKQEFASRMDEILRMLKSSPPAPDTEQVLAPGEIERQNEARNRLHGVPLVPSVIDQLAALGSEVEITFPSAKSKDTVEARP